MCEKGHQIISIGGSRFYKTNKAITLGCYDLKDSDEVIFKGENMKWVKFKSIFPNWDFTSTSNENKIRF